MRFVMVVTACIIAVLVAVGALVMANTDSSPNDDLQSGTYETIEAAEKAVGFSIPHARDLGPFRLTEVSVSGGTRVPGNVDQATMDRLLEEGWNRGFTHVLGSSRTEVLIMADTHTEWGISLTYQAETDQRYIVVSFSPRQELAPAGAIGSGLEAHGQPVFVQGLPPDRPRVNHVSVRWVGTYGFSARATLDSPELRSRGVQMEEFLTLVGSVR